MCISFFINCVLSFCVQSHKIKSNINLRVFYKMNLIFVAQTQISIRLRLMLWHNANRIDEKHWIGFNETQKIIVSRYDGSLKCDGKKE